MVFIVTGGCGFVGSHFSDLLVSLGHQVIVMDKLTYAGTASNVPAGAQFVRRDINDRIFFWNLLSDLKPNAVFNFAAESHVCRSIAEPETFLHSNVMGTFSLLQECLKYWQQGKPPFRFVQVSTDEVFGDLSREDFPFSEDSRYLPNSPYAASKAAADHLVRSWGHTYGLPVTVTHCSNNYGSRQHPEKLIPLIVTRALKGERITLHGDGSNIRDWIHVSDHCRGIWAAYEKGDPGRSYCFGGKAERTNLAVTRQILDYLGLDWSLISFGADRPGNDRRYAINNARVERELGWKPLWEFLPGLSDTIEYYRKAL